MIDVVGVVVEVGGVISIDPEACEPQMVRIKVRRDKLGALLDGLVKEERERCLRVIRNGCGDTVIEDRLVEAVESGDYD